MSPSDPVGERQRWLICVGGGYGCFVFEGSEKEAEEMRRHKATWEGAVARKRPASDLAECEKQLDAFACRGEYRQKRLDQLTGKEPLDA